MSTAYIPHVPAKSFHYEESRLVFRQIFEDALDTMWASPEARQPNAILADAWPTFNLVTTGAVMLYLNQSITFNRELAKRTEKELGILYKLELKWDPLKPEQLRHQESNLPAELPPGTELFTPRPHIYSAAVYFTKEEAHAIGLPGHQLPF